MIVCESCKRQIEDHWLFCRFCGTEVVHKIRFDDLVAADVYKSSNILSSSGVVDDVAFAVVVDLENSGFGAKGYDFHPNHPLLPPLDQNNVREIVITFSPGGKVGYVYYGGDALGQNVLRVRPIGSVHLLVGHIDQLASANPPNPSELNLADASNLWVSIAGQSGRITTSENRGLDQVDLVNVDPTVPIPPLLHGQLLWRARTFAVQSQSMGGR